MKNLNMKIVINENTLRGLDQLTLPLLPNRKVVDHFATMDLKECVQYLFYVAHDQAEDLERLQNEFKRIANRKWYKFWD